MTVETLPTEVGTEIDTAALHEIEEKVVANVHLADLIRRGSGKTVQATGWGQGHMACALSAAGLEAESLGFIK